MKTKNEIVNEIANKRVVEQIVFQINRNEKEEDLKDLISYVYLQLLEKPEELVQGLYQRKELNFFLANIVYNQIRSKTSYFHRTYRLPRLKTKELNENMI